jgi:hypothetical protein
VLAVSGSAHAQAVSGSAVFERPMVEPWVPPQLREKSVTEAPRPHGAALEAQVDRKLRARFDAAAQGGLLTRGQARAAGLGDIAANFDAIDRAGRGSVRFEDYRAYLRSRSPR